MKALVSIVLPLVSLSGLNFVKSWGKQGEAK